MLQPRLIHYYAGAVIVLALILGGGTDQGIWTDHVIQIIMLPALFLGLGGIGSSRFGTAALVLGAAIVLLIVLQFLPIPRATLLDGALPGTLGISMWSPVPQRSLEAGLFTLSLVGFALLISHFSDADQAKFLRFLMVGFFVNMIVGVIQLSFDQRVTVTGVLPFEIQSGLFANENHFSSLIYVMIPLLAYHFLARSRQIGLYLLTTGLLVFFLFAIGSRAGMAISAALSALSLFWFVARKLPIGLRAGLFVSGIGVVLFLLYLRGFDDPLEGDLRQIFFATTWKAILDHWLVGTGLGSFELVYGAYETRENIIDLYANHAHNDYLEIILETGVVGFVLVVFYFILIFRHFRHSPLAEAAALSIAALALHSLVDYPIRTMALGVIFAYLSAIVLSTKPYEGEEQPELAPIPQHPSAPFPSTRPRKRRRW